MAISESIVNVRAKEFLKNLIIRQPNPDRIILFGSRAKGTVAHDSDRDFLILK
jgi:predicted nucleotidyltransferase